jgi:hypothetical protein
MMCEPSRYAEEEEGSACEDVDECSSSNDEQGICDQASSKDYVRIDQFNT